MLSNGWVSPPELSSTGGTISSKSSSLLSSFQLDDGSGLNDLGHFEEIGLNDEDDEDIGYNSKPMLQKLSRSLGGIGGRPLSTMSTQSRNSTSAIGNFRDLTNGQPKRPMYPSLQPHMHTIASDHLVPYTPGTRRAASAAAPAANRAQRATSPAPLPGSPGIRPSMSNGAAQAGRRSWQATRKTVEEIENEYDSDDDVPAEMILHNVPLSPRSARALSATTSPERTSTEPINGNPNPTPPATRPPTRGASTSGVPALGEIVVEDRGRSQYRSKSWNDAMSELGYEAKELSEALEKYADVETEKTEKRLALGKAEIPKSVPLPKTAPVQLPPLQVTNGMIDPLPISKEKEAVLSRTRPSWLPPKSKEEEKRHLREYKKMMRLSQEAEKKRVDRERAELAEKDRVKSETHRVWDTQIIPNWDAMIQTNATRELWWRGVAPQCRGLVWSLSFGNHLTVGPETFRLALNRARDVEEGVKKSPAMYSFKERELFTAIRRDVVKTFPELKIFQENGPLNGSLVDVLQAYAMYRSDVGYVYGTHTVAGLLLLNLSPEKAFMALVNLLNRPLPLAFYTQDSGAMSRVYNLFLKAFKYKLPSLYQHIHVILCLSPPDYLEAMFLTLFSLHAPLEITSRIWDVYGFEGDTFLVRCAIGVMTVLESRLYGNQEEILGTLGWGARTKWELGSEDVFMEAVRGAGKEEKEEGESSVNGEKW